MLSKKGSLTWPSELLHLRDTGLLSAFTLVDLGHLIMGSSLGLRSSHLTCFPSSYVSLITSLPLYLLLWFILLSSPHSLNVWTPPNKYLTLSLFFSSLHYFLSWLTELLASSSTRVTPNSLLMLLIFLPSFTFSFPVVLWASPASPLSASDVYSSQLPLLPPPDLFFFPQHPHFSRHLDKKC